MAKRKKSHGRKSKQAKSRQPLIAPKASSFQQQLNQAEKLIMEGDLIRAEPLCTALIRQHPDDLHTLKVTGILRYYQHRYMEAISLLERVDAVDPQDIQTRRMLISSYQDGKQDEKAMSMARTLLNHPLTVEETMLAFNVFHELCDWQTSASMQDDLIRKIRAAGAKGITLGPSFLLALNGLDNTDPDTLFELHGFHGIRKPSVPLPRMFTPGQLNPRGRLKIAYLSPDFNTHPVAYFIYPVIAAHNRQNVDVYCYAHLTRQDDITDKFREAADHFIDITAMTHAEAARRIQADGIHVLIDLAGHTANSHLPVLRWKPAPVQVSWLGYPNTSGIPEVDFHITDHYAECEGGTRYMEQLLYMPESFICFGMRPTCLRAETAPVESTGFITFGSFANTRKMNPRVIGAWSRILNRVPNSRMALKARWKSDIVRDHVLAEFARHGVDNTRIIFLPVTDTYDEHADQYNRVDIALDTFPYNGTTTTCEALLMGVPVVTLIGKTHANRVSYSILKNIAFEVTSAKTLDDYVDKAVNLAINPGGLSVLRKTLPTLFEYSIVGQPERFAPQLEALYMDACRRKGVDLSEMGYSATADGREDTAPSDAPASEATHRLNHDFLPDREPNNIEKEKNEVKPKLRIIHNLARSGGTLICKCLGCMEDIVLLSEIHPQACDRFNPLNQAHEWHHLLTDSDIQQLQNHPMDFPAAIRLIEQRCRERGTTLVIRDWAHLDFVAFPFLQAPTYRLQLADALSDDFELTQLAIVRHPIDAWLSLSREGVMADAIRTGRFGINEFLHGYLRFMEQCKDFEFIRYEDFTNAPEMEIKQMCEKLDTLFDADFINKWSSYTTITGDVTSTRGGNKITPLKRRPASDDILSRFSNNPDYWSLLDILGYEEEAIRPMATVLRN